MDMKGGGFSPVEQDRVTDSITNLLVTLTFTPTPNLRSQKFRLELCFKYNQVINKFMEILPQFS